MMNNLDDLYAEALQEMYSAESLQLAALPPAADEVKSPDLERGFLEFIDQTRQQLDLLEQVAARRGVSLRGKKSTAVEGMTGDLQDLLRKIESPEVLDAALIAVVQKLKHHEIASYGTLRSFAGTLGFEDDAGVFQKILEEEAMANEKLTALAENHINSQAASQAGR